MPRLGIHTSISKGLHHAAALAAGVGANTFQIFSASPRMWRAAAPKPEEIAELRKLRRKHDLTPMVVHGSYLINLSSLEPLCRERSIAAFRQEWERCQAIGVDYLVVHPGNYKGQSIESGIQQFVLGLAEAVQDQPKSKLMLLLEGTAGCGAALGSNFEELAALRGLARKQTKIPVGYCLDTAHLLAVGHDIASQKGLRETVKAAESVLGLEHVRVIHTNDSKVPLGSRVDRHTHIGEGYIGYEGFQRILTHPKLRDKPFVLETPWDEDSDGQKNMDALKRLCQRSSTTTA